MRKTQAFANTANLLATMAYVVVITVLFQPFRPVSKRVSLVAAFGKGTSCSLPPFLYDEHGLPK
jgi:hypothetical protein